MRPRRVRCVLLLSSVLLAASSSADIHYVATNGFDNTPYANWVDAATNIQAAVDAACAGDTVLLSNGLHRLPATVVVTNAVVLSGLDGPDEVIVDGRMACACFNLSNCSCVLSELTVTNGATESE